MLVRRGIHGGNSPCLCGNRGNEVTAAREFLPVHRIKRAIKLRAPTVSVQCGTTVVRVPLSGLSNWGGDHRTHAKCCRVIRPAGIVDRCRAGLGVRVPRKSGRIGHQPHHRGRSVRAQSAGRLPVSRIAAAQRQGSRHHLRRRPAAALLDAHPRHSGARVREGDLLHGRAHGARLPADRAPHPRRRPYARQPQPEPSVQLPHDVGARRRARDRGRLRVDRGRGRRSRQGGAVLPVPRPAPAGFGRALSAIEAGHELERRLHGRRLDAHQFARDRPPRARAGWKPRARASCCCTTSSRRPRSACRNCCASSRPAAIASCMSFRRPPDAAAHRHHRRPMAGAPPRRAVDQAASRACGRAPSRTGCERRSPPWRRRASRASVPRRRTTPFR